MSETTKTPWSIENIGRTADVHQTLPVRTRALAAVDDVIRAIGSVSSPAKRSTCGDLAGYRSRRPRADGQQPENRRTDPHRRRPSGAIQTQQGAAEWG